MSQPLRLLKNPAQTAAIVSRFSGRGPVAGTSYATVRDYCESLDELPQITAVDGDLKNVQRPWATRWKMLMCRSRASGVRSSKRLGLRTRKGAVNEPLKNTDPVRRTARSISDSRSTPAGRSGVSANEGGVPVIVDGP